MNKSRLRDAVYGLAVADAVGVPAEFKKRGSFLITDMVGYGMYNQPAGTWSDDTSMTLATCNAIREYKCLDIGAIRKAFECWLFQGAFTPDGVVFDCGGTTSTAIYHGHGCFDQESNGNGSLMRIIPLAFLDVTDEEIQDVSAITHGHEISKRACVIYVRLAQKLLSGDSIMAAVQNLDEQSPFDRLSTIERLTEIEIRSSGYVVDTLEAALWCLVKTTNYKDCILKAVNLGYDTDTVAAVAGGLAGIIYGFEGIPGEWIETLRAKELIEQCLF